MVVLVSLEGLVVSIGVAVAIGDSAVFVVVVVVSVEVAGDSAGDAAGVTVSVFCSHAASNAALARMQMYFFIG